MLGGSAFFICQISAKSLFSQVLGAKLVFWGLVFVLGFSNFEKSTEIRSENFSLVKQPARALYLNRGKVFWLFYLPNFQSVKKQDRRYSDLNS